MMIKFIVQEWKWLATTIFAVFALLISLKSCDIADDSNEIANNALELSQKQFYQINKPFLGIKAKRFDSDSYFKIRVEGKTVEIKVKFEIKNLGNAAAVNIHFPDRAAIPKKLLEQGGLFQFNIPKNLVLGPNDNFSMYIEIKLQFENDKIGKLNYTNFGKKEWEGIKLIIPLSYQSEIDNSVEFRLIELYHIKHNDVKILSSELKTFYK